MILRKTLLTAAVLLVSIPVVPALAHDDDDNRYDSHDRFHDQLSDAHERAHEYGFYSRGEHRAYHRALRDIHGEAHGYQPRSYYYSRPRFYGFGWGY
jgi:predicted alpha/beta hydrolase